MTKHMTQEEYWDSLKKSFTKEWFKKARAEYDAKHQAQDDQPKNTAKDKA